MDHAGIATQTVVEKQLQKSGVSRHHLGVALLLPILRLLSSCMVRLPTGLSQHALRKREKHPAAFAAVVYKPD
jgi:hypothetical protein